MPAPWHAASSSDLDASCSDVWADRLAKWLRPACLRLRRRIAFGHFSRGRLAKAATLAGLPLPSAQFGEPSCCVIGSASFPAGSAHCAVGSALFPEGVNQI